MICPKCGADDWREAMSPKTKTALTLVGEGLFVLFAAIGVAYKSVPAAIGAILGAAFAFVVTLRSRHLVCAKCGWTIARRQKPEAGP